MAAILTFVSVVGFNSLWKKYEFRKWVCEISFHQVCYDLIPIPENIRKEVQAEWEKNNPGKDL